MAAVALLGAGAVLSVGPAFLASPPSPSPLAVPRSSTSAVATTHLDITPHAIAGVAGSGGVTATTAVALMAVAAAALRRRSKAPSSVAQSVALMPFAGAVVQSGTDEKPLVARKSMNSCYNLYFGNKKGFNYSDRARRNLRNRAYNIFMKNMYKKAMKRVLTYCIDLEFGDDTPASLDAVWGDVKDLLDEACEIVDEVCVQGVIHRNTAARRKDRMCRAILRGSIVKGLIKKPEDRFEPAYKTLKYEMPVCTLTREPRPWQLPGWKSPWMLKREYKKWTNSKQEEEA